MTFISNLLTVIILQRNTQVLLRFWLTVIKFLPQNNFYAITYLELRVSYNDCYFHIIVLVQKYQTVTSICIVPTLVNSNWLCSIPLCIPLKLASFVTVVLLWIIFRFLYINWSLYLLISAPPLYFTAIIMWSSSEQAPNGLLTPTKYIEL